MNACARCGRPLAGNAGVILVTEAFAVNADGLRTHQHALCSYTCLVAWASALLWSLAASMDEETALERMAALPSRDAP